MRINIVLSEPISGKFAGINLCYTDINSTEVKVPLNVEFQPLYDFTRVTDSTSFDFFLFSAIVYGVDNLLDRHIYSIDGWSREIEITFPVKNVILWQELKETIEQLLKFLTGDHWQIDFTSINIRRMFLPRTNRRTSRIPCYNKHRYQYVSLFSGGLDSLVGVIDLLEQLSISKKILLVSHFDSNSVGPNRDQKILLEYLKRKYPNKIDWIQSTITVDNVDEDDKGVKKDSNYRSRSVLFLGLANFLIYTVPNVRELVIPENGTISLNHPLTPSRSSSLSTRTTHPYVISMINDLFNSLNISSHVANPYAFRTKGEIVNECRNKEVLSGIYIESVSCGKRGRRQNWMHKTGTNHCGVCMPCIYRRAALQSQLWDTQLYGNDLLNLTNENDYVDSKALIDYLSTDLTINQIEKNLLVNGSLPIQLLQNYAEVIFRSRVELKNWINVRGNDYIKTIIGLS